MKKAAKETKRQPRDINQLAYAVVESLTGDGDLLEGLANEEAEKDPAAIARGKARAAKLPAKRRRVIAKKAAKARWQKSS